MIDFSHSTWQKSTRSQQSGQCVELARTDGWIGLRDSKEPGGPVLVFTAEEFATFLDGVVKNEFDDLH